MIPETELILNPDGSIYHLNLRPEDIADTILTVGDPDRVALVSRHFDRVELRKQKREFVTHTGFVGIRRLTVISSGIGVDNVEILMNELDALVNIDLMTRLVRPQPTQLSIIRLGTSGSLRPDIGIDSLVASATGTGLDSLMQFYALPQTDLEATRARTLQHQLGLSWQPYQVDGSEFLLAQVGVDFPRVNTLTCPGFYAPQGRHLRLAPRLEHYLNRLVQYESNSCSFDNLEMETAGYYAFGRLLGHEVLSLSAILAERLTGKFSSDPERIIGRLITTVLDRLASN